MMLRSETDRTEVEPAGQHAGTGMAEGPPTDGHSPRVDGGCLDREAVKAIERDRISTRREKAFGVGRGGWDEGQPDLVGLALSGGGIRSAMFNLGILRALNKSGLLRYVDLLSTVSGGGYIGGYLSARGVRRAEQRPAGPAESGDDPDDGPMPPDAFDHALGSESTPPDVTRRFDFLAKPLEFYYRYTIGLLANALPLLAFACFISLFSALVFRAFDEVDPTIQSEIEAKDFGGGGSQTTLGNHLHGKGADGKIQQEAGAWWRRFTYPDLVRALAPPILLAMAMAACLMVAATATVGRLRRLRAFGMQAADILGKLMLASLACSIVIILTNFDTSISDQYVLTLGDPGYTGRSVPGNKGEWILPIGVVVQAILSGLAFLMSRRFISFGPGAVQTTFGKVLGLLATASAILPFLLLLAWFGRENYSGMKTLVVRSSDAMAEYGFWMEHRLRDADKAASRRSIAETISLIDSEVEEIHRIPRGRTTSIFAETNRLVRQYVALKGMQERLEGLGQAPEGARGPGQEDRAPSPPPAEPLTAKDLDEVASRAQSELSKLVRTFFDYNPVAERNASAAYLVARGITPDPLKDWVLKDRGHDEEPAALDDEEWIYAFLCYTSNQTDSGGLAVPPLGGLRNALENKEGHLYQRADLDNRYLVNFDQSKRRLSFLWVLLGFGLTSTLIPFNLTSLHLFYRDRLRSAFLFADRTEEGLDRPMHELRSTDHGYPYQIVSCTLNVPHPGPAPAVDRNFIFSEGYSGSTATNYQKTADYRGGRTKLSDALAISGAAFTPLQTDSLPLRLLMLLVNARLGQWYVNPRLRLGRARTAVGEYLGSSLLMLIVNWFRNDFLKRRRATTAAANDRDPGREEGWCRQGMLFLSDGAHYDNLGLELLLERRCSLIIVSDVSNDDQFQLADFLSVLRRARERGIRFYHKDRKWDPRTRKEEWVPLEQWLSRWVDDAIREQIEGQGAVDEAVEAGRRAVDEPLLIGRICYDDREGTEPDPSGWFVMFKPVYARLDLMDVSLFNYFRSSRTFPHDPGLDQFFTRNQAEAYRLLGEHIGSLLQFECAPDRGARESVDAIMSRLEVGRPPGGAARRPPPRARKRALARR
jgi:hypothetical protein